MNSGSIFFVTGIFCSYLFGSSFLKKNKKQQWDCFVYTSKEDTDSQNTLLSTSGVDHGTSPVDGAA